MAEFFFSYRLDAENVASWLREREGIKAFNVQNVVETEASAAQVEAVCAVLGVVQQGQKRCEDCELPAPAELLVEVRKVGAPQFETLCLSCLGEWTAFQQDQARKAVSNA